MGGVGFADRIFPRAGKKASTWKLIFVSLRGRRRTLHVRFCAPPTCQLWSTDMPFLAHLGTTARRDNRSKLARLRPTTRGLVLILRLRPTSIGRILVFWQIGAKFHCAHLRMQCLPTSKNVQTPTFWRKSRATPRRPRRVKCCANCQKTKSRPRNLSSQVFGCKTSKTKIRPLNAKKT